MKITCGGLINIQFHVSQTIPGSISGFLSYITRAVFLLNLVYIYYASQRCRSVARGAVNYIYVYLSSWLDLQSGKWMLCFSGISRFSVCDWYIAITGTYPSDLSRCKSGRTSPARDVNEVGAVYALETFHCWLPYGHLSQTRRYRG